MDDLLTPNSAMSVTRAGSKGVGKSLVRWGCLLSCLLAHLRLADAAVLVRSKSLRGECCNAVIAGLNSG